MNTAATELKDGNTTEELIREKLDIFDETIRNHEFLEIDGDIEADAPNEHIIKVINHNTEGAHSVTVDTIVRQKLVAIVRALETGVTTRLFGITRIVGYYSRINNWNRSKKAELADRHMGNYKLADCKDLVGVS